MKKICTTIICQYKYALFEYKILLKHGGFQKNSYFMNVHLLKEFEL